jgi:hypothetical protein
VIVGPDLPPRLLSDGALCFFIHSKVEFSISSQKIEVDRGVLRGKRRTLSLMCKVDVWIYEVRTMRWFLNKHAALCLYLPRQAQLFVNRRGHQVKHCLADQPLFLYTNQLPGIF